MNANFKFGTRMRHGLLLTSFGIGTALAVTLSPVPADDMYRPVAKAGGVEIRPSITSLRTTPTNSTIEWYGLKGGYHVEASTIPGSEWVEVTNALAATYSNSVTISGTAPEQKFFRLRTDNSFVGARGCSSCHYGKYNDWSGTAHAGAWDSIAGLPAQTQKNCIACHVVGFGQPTGFTSTETTPNLANVGCENCHGAAAAHKYGDHSIAKPVVTAAAENCGGCHDGSHHPTYSEWTNTAHASVNEDVASGFSDTAAGQSRMTSCGPCHSGATRIAMLRQYENQLAGYSKPLNLPTAHDASLYGVTCAICHDPHASEFSHQVRNPISSTNNFSLLSSSTFVSQYNPEIQICAQCHNDRGASWTSTARPPHHSPQYNFLLGTIGQQQNGQPPGYPASHALLITNQCVGCHMQSQPYSSEEKPAASGHSFKVQSFDMCRNCHALPEDLLQFTTNAVSSQIQQVKQALDLWALTKAPAGLSVYGTRAWEYTSPGSLSTGGPGPSSAEQVLIPANIQKARFNLYVVFHDGSFGVHNARLAATLLDNALSWVEQELGN